MNNSYLSKDRHYINKLQRERRASMVRIDYYPSKETVAAINALRRQYAPYNNNSGILDRIVNEWAKLSGIK